MGFIGIFIFILPIIAAMLAIFIALLFFIGLCLLTIGITGAVMNKIHAKQTQSTKKVSGTLFNIVSVITGIALMLFPMGYALYSIISAFFS